jgi:hypothetical protein
MKKYLPSVLIGSQCQKSSNRERIQISISDQCNNYDIIIIQVIYDASKACFHRLRFDNILYKASYYWQQAQKFKAKVQSKYEKTIAS